MSDKQLNNDDIKKVLVRMLGDFDNLCSENGIRYSIAFGTMLGAIRHKGFIPWDDDVDLFVPRQDFEKLRKIFNNQANLQYDLISVEDNKDFNSILPKIVDKGTYLKQFTEGDIKKKRSFELGVYIDLFILDEIPDDSNLRDKVFKKTVLRQKIWSFSYFTPNKNHNTVVNTFRHFANSLNISPILARKMNAKAQAYHGECYGNLLLGGCPRPTYIISKKEFDELGRFPFENIQLNCVKSYDHLLAGWYGDYMKFPSEEDRVSNHTFAAYWK